MKRKLDFLVNGSIAILCLTVSSILIKGHFFPEVPEGPPQATAKGEILELPEALAPGTAELVVVAALAPGCGYCNESMTFYRSLSDRRSAEAADLRFVAAVRNADQAEPERSKLEAEGVEFDQVVVTDFDSLGIPGTPMLIVADRRGEVLGAWLGKLTEHQEQEVFETLGLAEHEVARGTSWSDGAISAGVVVGDH